MAAIYKFSSLHIIESLGDGFKNPGQKLLERLRASGGRMARFPITYHDGIDREAVLEILGTIYREEAENGLVPILHFEAEGGTDGLSLRLGPVLPWAELVNQLRAFNLATQFNLVVAFSCCNGIHLLSKISFKTICPFSLAVACEGGILTSELLNGYERFYDILVSTGDARKAATALQSAVNISVGTKFSFLTAQSAFRTVCEGLKAFNRKPANHAREMVRVRKKLDAAVTDVEIEGILRAAEAQTLQTGFDAFFATKEIPSNRERFNFWGLVGY